MAGTLHAHVDWHYLMYEFRQMYRFGSAGGSKPIRSHLKAVRNQLNAEMALDPAVSLPEPARLPVVDWLGRALDRGRQTPTASLVDTIDRVQHQLAWRYGYDRVPRSLQGKYAFAELMGPKGPVVSERLILGLVLLTPGCTYPSHAHDGITESYICLSGTLSENDVGVYAPGSLLYNPPNHRHRLTTGDHEPVLLAYAWSGAPERLANQKMTFKKS
ncbi:dimethylsulfonioproprionate lyase family protein [Salinisphaera orenii]|uniref:Dimethlysulfonioproprionate lyase DddL n=1 Tax=Salinisphaera orenii YIM 95161 TaxID=1051139 RepID=A0A423PDR0_9GAMM|nr:dimethylsulfonioproprionate lyase family protein [Salinisphaera halophila]ROO23098.1 hypothetical protein SAHL_16945 [Salinisphaera halophila YIM 95161]